jgi:hypothetical protein
VNYLIEVNAKFIQLKHTQSFSTCSKRSVREYSREPSVKGLVVEAHAPTLIRMRREWAKRKAISPPATWNKVLSTDWVLAEQPCNLIRLRMNCRDCLHCGQPMDFAREAHRLSTDRAYGWKMLRISHNPLGSYPAATFPQSQRCSSSAAWSAKNT